MIVDLCVYLGYWPFHRLRNAGAAGVRRLMARTGASRALAAPLQAVFYKHCTDGVLEMIEDIGPVQDDLLPLAMVNPNFPGWERDLEQQIHELGCVACGIVPHYHGYRVYDPCAGQLFARLSEMNLPAVLFVRFWDERSHHWCMQVPPLAVDDVTYVLKQFPQLPTIVCNANLPSEGIALAPSLVGRAPTLLTTAYKSLKLDLVAEQIGIEHLAYASGAPMYYPESALLQVLDAQISERERDMVLCQNACGLLGLEVNPPC